MDLSSVFKIDKIQGQSVSTLYLTVCLYSYLRLALSELHLLAIITKLSYQIAWPMTIIGAPALVVKKAKVSKESAPGTLDESAVR